VLLRFAYLGVTNIFAMLRLLPTNDRAKDIQILALRHQIMVLERRLGEQGLRFDPSDRALLARAENSVVAVTSQFSWTT
jgi:putative transposase